MLVVNDKYYRMLRVQVLLRFLLLGTILFRVSSLYNYLLNFHSKDMVPLLVLTVLLTGNLKGLGFKLCLYVLLFLVLCIYIGTELACTSMCNRRLHIENPLIF